MKRTLRWLVAISVVVGCGTGDDGSHLAGSRDPAFDEVDRRLDVTVVAVTLNGDIISTASIPGVASPGTTSLATVIAQHCDC